jgi:hypothetical protein
MYMRTFFVDVDMLYKSAHHCLYQICKARNSKCFEPRRWSNEIDGVVQDSCWGKVITRFFAVQVYWFKYCKSAQLESLLEADSADVCRLNVKHSKISVLMKPATTLIGTLYEETLPIIISSQFSGHSNERKWKPRVDWLKMTSLQGVQLSKSSSVLIGCSYH